MRSNLTILEQNTLLGFEHEDTKALYLRGAQIDEAKAFWVAVKWESMLRPFLHSLVPQGAQLHADNPHAAASPEEVAGQVIDFIRERHFRSSFPNQ